MRRISGNGRHMPRGRRKPGPGHPWRRYQTLRAVGDGGGQVEDEFVGSVWGLRDMVDIEEVLTRRQWRSIKGRRL